MSKVINYKRRGEWVELTPGKAIKAGSDPKEAALIWLKETMDFPDKLLQKLVQADEVRVAGDRLRLRLFPEREAGFPALGDPATVLFEDDFCLVVHKPAGCKVHPDGDGKHMYELTLAHRVASYYAQQGERVAVRHIHRLDENTTGPVLYAKNEFAQLKLDQAMAMKEIHRTYVAFVHGNVNPGLRVIDAPIGRDRHHKQRRRVSPSGKPAVTRIELLEKYAKASLVRLHLETGRTHQIRVHMQHTGHPLIGDGLYGGETRLLPYQALHGESLEFVHPLTGQEILIEDPWPEALLMLKNNL